MPEVRVQTEGAMRWVRGSGSGRTWATASAPTSGLVGFCTEFSYTSALRTVQVSERGIPDHHKVVGKDPIELNVSYLWTGAQPSGVSGAGASVPMDHLEFKAGAPEIGAASGFYYQFYGCVMESVEFQEAEDGNNISVTYKALGMNGPTASGYLG